jgi:hypothetical protein
LKSWSSPTWPGRLAMASRRKRSKAGAITIRKLAHDGSPQGRPRLPGNQCDYRGVLPGTAFRRPTPTPGPIPLSLDSTMF